MAFSTPVLLDIDIYILLPNSIRCKNVKYSVTLEGWILAKVMTTRQRKGEGS